jgi:hypothetical protein
MPSELPKRGSQTPPRAPGDGRQQPKGSAPRRVRHAGRRFAVERMEQPEIPIGRQPGQRLLISRRGEGLGVRAVGVAADRGILPDFGRLLRRGSWPVIPCTVRTAQKTNAAPASAAIQ